MNQATNRGPMMPWDLYIYIYIIYIIHCVNPRKKDMGSTSLTQRLDETQKLSRGRVICRVKVSWRMGWYHQCPCFIILMLTKRLDPQKKYGISALWTKNKEISVFTQGNLQVPPGSNTTFCWFAMCFILAPYHHKPTAFFPVFSYELLLSQDWEEQVEISNDNVLTSVVFKI